MLVGWGAGGEKGHTQILIAAQTRACALNFCILPPGILKICLLLQTTFKNQSKMGETLGQGCIACGWTLEKD